MISAVLISANSISAMKFFDAIPQLVRPKIRLVRFFYDPHIEKSTKVLHDLKCSAIPYRELLDDKEKNNQH